LTIKLSDRIFRLLDSEHNAEVQNYTEIYSAKDELRPPGLHIQAHLKLSPNVSAVQFLLFPWGIKLNACHLLRHLRSCHASPLQTGWDGNALPSRVTGNWM